MSARDESTARAAPPPVLLAAPLRIFNSGIPSFTDALVVVDDDIEPVAFTSNLPRYPETSTPLRAALRASTRSSRRRFCSASPSSSSEIARSRTMFSRTSAAISSGNSSDAFGLAVNAISTSSPHSSRADATVTHASRAFLNRFTTAAAPMVVPARFTLTHQSSFPSFTLTSSPSRQYLHRAVVGATRSRRRARPPSGVSSAVVNTNSRPLADAIAAKHRTSTALSRAPIAFPTVLPSPTRTTGARAYNTIAPSSRVLGPSRAPVVSIARPTTHARTHARRPRVKGPRASSVRVRRSNLDIFVVVVV